MVHDNNNIEDLSADAGVQTRFTAGDTPSEETIRAVAALKGKRPTAVGPLSTVVDPDALNQLFAEPHVFEEEPLVVTFTMSGCHVTLQSDGRLFVQYTELSHDE